MARIGIIGEFDAGFFPHVATNAALGHVAAVEPVEWCWRSAGGLTAGNVAGELAGWDGVWIAPGSPYASLDGALAVIRYARERGLPLFGT